MNDDPAVAAELPPKPPGHMPVGEVNYEAPDMPSDFLATGERLAFAQASAGPPPLPAVWQLLADWSSQPPPAFGGAANTIHFYLNHTNGIGYEGCMFFKAASPPYHPFISRNRFYGTGHVYPNVPWGSSTKQLDLRACRRRGCGSPSHFARQKVQPV